MHVHVRLLCLLLFAIGLSWLPFSWRLAIFCGSLSLLFVARYRQLFVTGVRRLRWLLLMMLLLYGWFTPGEAVFESLGQFSPSRVGLLLAVDRMLVLALVVAAASLYLAFTRLEQIVGSIYWIARRLGLGQARAQRIALRVALVLRQLPQVDRILQQRAKGQNWVDIVRDAIVTIENPVDQPALELPGASPIGLWQWLWVLALGAVIFMSGRM